MLLQCCCSAEGLKVKSAVTMPTKSSWLLEVGCGRMACGSACGSFACSCRKPARLSPTPAGTLPLFLAELLSGRVDEMHPLLVAVNL